MPLIMGALRKRMLRRRRSARFSMPQFRILDYLRRHEGATLSAVARHSVLMRPTVSKMIDCLVQAGWVARQADSRDRRRLRLCLTDKGMARIDATRHEMGASLAESLGPLSPHERQTVIRAMRILQSAFTQFDHDDGKPHNGRYPAA